MEIREAIERLKSRSIIPFDNDSEEVCNLAIQSLEKQIPKKPKLQSKIDGDCQICYAPVRKFSDSWCWNCGQKLDWL